MTKIKNRKIDPSYEIYLGLYQALTGPNEEDKIFKNVSRDFFDLIVWAYWKIDGCTTLTRTPNTGCWHNIVKDIDAIWTWPALQGTVHFGVVDDIARFGQVSEEHDD